MLQASEPRAYKLLHEGVQALSRVEHAGIRVNVDYLDHTIKETGEKIKRLQNDMRGSAVGKHWRRKYSDKTNFGSGTQLAAVLMELGHELPRTKATENFNDDDKRVRYSTDVSAIENVDDPFVALYLECEKLKKVKDTFLTGIKRETINGFLHPGFHLHRTRTYRSSSSNINFQNLPIRNPVQGAIVRKCFIARPGRRIVEIDYGGIEVCIAACYHKDPRMMTYITDETKDMHRDMAAQCYKLKPAQVAKMTRYAGKNMFVFPQFYGDYYVSCARALWEWLERNDLTLKDSDVRVMDNLARAGITERGACKPGERPVEGTFESHIKSVENHFWNKRFPVYKQWKLDWFAKYQRNGYFVTKTGFRLEGNYGRNDVINYPVQGSAFHCLLQSLIWLQKTLRRRKMKTLIVGQIHDSIVADVPDNELNDYLEVADTIMTKRLPSAWDWINVPLEVEAEVTPVEGNWHEKETMSYG